MQVATTSTAAVGSTSLLLIQRSVPVRGQCRSSWRCRPAARPRSIGRPAAGPLLTCSRPAVVVAFASIRTPGEAERNHVGTRKAPCACGRAGRGMPMPSPGHWGMPTPRPSPQDQRSKIRNPQRPIPQRHDEITIHQTRRTPAVSTARAWSMHRIHPVRPSVALHHTNVQM